MQEVDGEGKPPRVDERSIDRVYFEAFDLSSRFYFAASSAAAATS